MTPRLAPGAWIVLAALAIGLGIILWVYSTGSERGPAVWIDGPIIKGAPALPPDECTRLVTGGSRDVRPDLDLHAFMQPDNEAGRWILQQAVGFPRATGEWKVNVEFKPCIQLFYTTFTLCVGSYDDRAKIQKMEEETEKNPDTEFDRLPPSIAEDCVQSLRYIIRLPTSCDFWCKVGRILALPPVAAFIGALATAVVVSSPKWGPWILARLTWLTRRPSNREESPPAP